MVFGAALVTLAAAFVAASIWRQQGDAPDAAFWSFAILIASGAILLILGPVVTDRIYGIEEITKSKDELTIRMQHLAVRTEKAEQRAEAALEAKETPQTKDTPQAKDTPPAPTKTGWILQRSGDCTGRDIGETAGTEPAADKCSGPDVTAVCWDGTLWKNGSKFSGDAWCTYKRIPADACSGGSAPGRLFRCVK
jgi:hypothetical protein